MPPVTVEPECRLLRGRPHERTATKEELHDIDRSRNPGRGHAGNRAARTGGHDRAATAATSASRHDNQVFVGINWNFGVRDGAAAVVGYGFQAGAFLGNGGVRVPYADAGTDYLFGKGWQPYIGVDSLKPPKAHTETLPCPDFATNPACD